jgi:hypothetical protein
MLNKAAELHFSAKCNNGFSFLCLVAQKYGFRKSLVAL